MLATKGWKVSRNLAVQIWSNNIRSLFPHVKVPVVIKPNKLKNWISELFVFDLPLILISDQNCIWSKNQGILRVANVPRSPSIPDWSSLFLLNLLNFSKSSLKFDKLLVNCTNFLNWWSFLYHDNLLFIIL